MQTYKQHKSEGDALVTKAVADIKAGSINSETLEGKITKALTLYNQAAEGLVSVDEKVKADANAVSTVYHQKALAYKVLLEHASA